jgi:hypothetical protein
MRRYTAEEEERVRMQARVREWARAGLLDAPQGQRLEAGLRTGLKRTNNLLRVAIAVFTAIIVGASVALVYLTFSIRSEAAFGVTLATGGVICFCLADFLVGSARLYRYGVEEGLAVSAVTLLSIGTLVFVSAGHGMPRHADAVAALVVGAAAACVVYGRFGFVYAGIGAMIFAGLIPFQIEWRNSFQHLCAAAMFFAMFVPARALYRGHGDDFPGDQYATFEAAACVALYLSLNLHAVDLLAGRWLWSPRAPGGGAFYWATYAATWIVPAVVLLDAIRAKDRPLLTAGLAIALVTLATNKPYLGWPRQTWDPMLLGILLAAVALAVRRWLATGPDRQRRGYTAARILRGDIDLLETAANVSVAWHDRVHQPPSGPPGSSPTFAGGRSGGGGGGASY